MAVNLIVDPPFDWSYYSICQVPSKSGEEASLVTNRMIMQQVILGYTVPVAFFE